MLCPAMTARLDQSATSWARCGFGIGGWSSVPIPDATPRPENLATVAGWVRSATLPSATSHPLVWAAGDVHLPAAHATSGSARRSRSLHCRHRHPQGLRCAGDRGGPARRRLVVLLRMVRPMAFPLLTQRFSTAFRHFVGAGGIPLVLVVLHDCCTGGAPATRCSSPNDAGWDKRWLASSSYQSQSESEPSVLTRTTG